MSVEKCSHENFIQDPNDWSKYQLMVLQQLDDHNKVLQNLNKEIIAINQSIAVNKAESDMWRTQTTSNLKELREEVDKILYDEKGINQRMVTMERDMVVEEKTNTKIKATWAFLGSIAVVAVNILIQIINAYFKTK
jgi:hypothetical protein